jgi:RNAse (barnase) inhibitor barstar
LLAVSGASTINTTTSEKRISKFFFLALLRVQKGNDFKHISDKHECFRSLRKTFIYQRQRRAKIFVLWDVYSDENILLILSEYFHIPKFKMYVLRHDSTSLSPMIIYKQNMFPNNTSKYYYAIKQLVLFLFEI